MRYAEEHLKHRQDFAPRRRVPTTLQFALIFAVYFGVMVIAYVYCGSLETFSIVAFLVTSFFAISATLNVQRNRDLMLATEFQNAIFSSAIGVESVFCLITRQDGSLVYADQGVQEIFPQFSHLRNRSLQSFLDMGRVTREESAAIYGAIDTSTQQRVVFTLRDADGRYRKMMLTIDPLARPSKFTLLRGREFVAQRHSGAEQATDAAAPATFSQLSDRLPIGLLAADAGGRVTFANRTLESWLGYAAGELAQSGALVTQLVVADERGGVENEQSKKVFLLTKSGQRMPVFAEQQAEYGADSQLRGHAVAFYPDAGDSVKKNTSLAHSGSGDGHDVERFIADAPIAVLQLAADGVLVSANATFHALTQRSFVSGLPRTLDELVGEAHREDAQALMNRLRTQDLPPTPQLLELALPNGAKVTVSLYVSRVAGEGGEGFLLYLIDVTEQKNLEMRFAHSQKMQAVGQLAGGVAHDFNNLLTAMIGFCDLLLMRHPAGDQSFADIMQIKQNANRAANLVRQLLAFSRRQTLQPKTLDITDVLAELSNLVRRLIGENIELKMVHGRDLGHVKADQGQLEQVIINLAVNARDAMIGGGVLTIQTSKVTITGRNSLPTDLIAPAEEEVLIPRGNYVLVQVSDTGTGIPREIVQKIFEPFFSTKEVGSGTGLGLSTVYGIVKQTGGYIFVTSQEGKGTSFHIYFPCHQSATGISAPTEAENHERSTADLTGRGTILLVEDETPVRIFSGRALRNKGYTVLEADCAETALEIMQTSGAEVEMIITDVIMPGMNGPTMVEKIVEQYPNIKVIFISGYAEDVFMNSYGPERSFNFLAKPFTLKQLAGKVKEVASAK